MLERWGPSCSLPSFKEQQTDDMIRVPRGTSVLQHNIGRCSKLLISSSALMLMLAEQTGSQARLRTRHFALIAAQKMCVEGKQKYNYLSTI